MDPQPLALTRPDEVLLAEALVAASFAYGDDQWTRAEVVKAFLRTVPEIRSLGVDLVYREAERNVRKQGAIARIRGLYRLSSLAWRRRCLLLAMDVAYSSGILDDGETLDAIKATLGIADREAMQYAAVLRTKYMDLARSPAGRRAG